MAPRISYAKTTLPFPIFAADFDPFRPGYLAVGGGGGEGRSGVPNQISILDVHSRASIETVADVEISRDEDSVQSIGTLGLADGLMVYAGINSSEAKQNAGNNEHLRSFEVSYPPRKKQKKQDGKGEKTETKKAEKGSWRQIGQRSLFKPLPGSKSETYQRILRLSPFEKRPAGCKRIGAIATGLAKNSQVIVFNATQPTPEPADILSRIDLPAGAEAADLDIAEPELSMFSVAYCTEYDVYEQTFKYDFRTKRCERMPKGPRRIYQMPSDDTAQSSNPRPKFRCVRFLNAQNVLVLSNRPNKGGVELKILHLYPTGPATEIAQKTLPSHVKAAVTMDICALDAGQDGTQQIAIAVAGQDVSITMYTTEFKEHSDTFTPLQKYTTLKNVHEHQITKLCFSAFHPPVRAPDPDEEPDSDNPPPPPFQQAGPQSIRLASVSYGNSVVVDTLDLSPLDPKQRLSRYVLQHPDDNIWTNWAWMSGVSLLVLLIAFFLQHLTMSYADYGTLDPIRYLPKAVQSYLEPAALPPRELELAATTPDQASPSPNSPTRLQTLRASLSAQHPSTDPDPVHGPVIVARPAVDSSSGFIEINMHPDGRAFIRDEDPRARHWHELLDEERIVWRARLISAGEWIEEQGKAELEGVLFSEMAVIVGDMET